VENYQFECGQYLAVIDAFKKHIPLSIASIPTDLPYLRIVFRPERNNPDSMLLDQLVQQKSIEISHPKGRVRYPRNHHQLLLIVKGTGISQALAIIDHSKAIHSTKDIKLLWVNNEGSIISRYQHFDSWLSQVDSMIFNDNDLSVWLKQNRSSINNANCILTGDPEFVYLTKKQLANNQIFLNSLQSDVFEYSPL